MPACTPLARFMGVQDEISEFDDGPDEWHGYRFAATRVVDRDPGKEAVHVDVEYYSLPAVRRRPRRRHFALIRVEDLLPDLVFLAAEER